MTIDWEPLAKLINDNERFVLTSHVRPDADALGSELAMAAILEQMGKTVRIVNPSETPAHLMFLDTNGRALKIGHGVTPQQACEADVHLILDTSAWAQLLDVGDVLRKTQATKAVIDHHVSSDDLGALEFKDTTAEATGALVFQLAQHLNAKIDETTAMALFCAIATDTGWFRFPSTTGDTLRIAGHLIDFGAKPHLIYQLLYERHSLERMKLVGRGLSNLRLACDGRLAYITVSLKDFAETGAVSADTEEMVNECLRIKGTIAAFIAIEQRNKQIKVSFRSRTDLNVAQVAETFGGGGHKQAAGAMVSGPMEEAIQLVRSALEQAITSS